MMAFRISAFFGLFLAWVSPWAGGTPPANLLPNPSFEKGRGRAPAGWRTMKWDGAPRFEWVREGGRRGRCVLVSSARGADAAWAAVVPVEPFAVYRLSGWIRAQGVETAGGKGALLNIHQIRGAATPAVTGTTDWKRVEVLFRTGEIDAVQVNCLLGGWGLARGKAWFDDLALELVEKKPVPSPSITIDARKEGAPLSKYIYGQFIEHLGKCVYGGIWAEMLEDRKFFLPPGAKKSPWRVLGGAGVLSMDPKDPFCGKWSPRITLSEGKDAGLAQGKLELAGGKEYAGRAWISAKGGVRSVRIQLAWGAGKEESASLVVESPGPAWKEVDFRFTSGRTTSEGRLEITGAGRGSFRVGPVSLMPADNVHGLRADTLKLLKELDSPVYRWPGGNFVSGYDWRDGIGPRDRRPPRWDRAWKAIEPNDFGIDEFLFFCRTLGTEPYITVNSGLGDAELAAKEVEYANGAPSTPMGRLRAKNGHPEPYGVKFWSIGNEMYGNWQLGHMPLAKYVKKHNRFAKAMRAVDPSIKLVAVGALGKWDEGMLAHCAPNMDYISEHFYQGRKPGLLAHVRQIPDAVRRIARAHRDYRRRIPALKGRIIPIALDEWNYWYGPHLFGNLGTRYYLRDALGIAAGLHELARQSDLFFMANYAQTVNVLGAIKTSKRAAWFEPTGLVLLLYRKYFGSRPVETKTSGLIDAQAAWNRDRSLLTLAVVNPTLREVKVPLRVKGAVLSGDAVLYRIAGGNPLAFNDPAHPRRVRIERLAIQSPVKELTLAPCSVNLFRFPLRVPGKPGREKGKKGGLPPYRNPALPPETRTADLLGRMTPAEKVAQLSFFYITGEKSFEGLKKFARRAGIGNLHDLFRRLPLAEGARWVARAQKILIRESRLGVPAIFSNEALHGLVAGNATSFPQAIGLAATFDPALMGRVAGVIARECRARGIRQVLSPVVNIARDPRWGRVEETYGEDPLLTSRMGAAYCRAMKEGGVVTTPKHFAVNFGDGGRDSNAVHFSRLLLHEIFFPGFEACIRQGGADSIMAAFDSIDGLPCSANPWLLTDVLRGEMGFKGFVMSDAGSVGGILHLHHLGGTKEAAVSLALKAGLDVELHRNGWFRDGTLLGAVKKGLVPMDVLDRAVRRVLSVKFRYGIFDHPFGDPAGAARIAGCPAHKALALKAAREAITLLKNAKATLPFGENVKTLALAGPLADRGRLGDYSRSPENAVSLLEGLNRLLGGKVKILHEKGCSLLGDKGDRASIARAAAAAGKADAAVVVVGIREGEGRDRSRLELPGLQEELIREVAAAGKPTVVVLYAGSAVTMERWIDKVGAVVDAWYPGELGGLALAEVLFGRTNPAGRLPITFPRRVGQVPLYYNYKPSGRGYGYCDGPGSPLFPFGHGLSYTSFKYSNLSIEPAKVRAGEPVKVSLEVENTGKRRGDEVVQLYLRDVVASMARPLKELKGFQRVTLGPGERKRVSFLLTPRDMSFLDRSLHWVLEPGEFRVMAGASSADIRLKGSFRVD